VAAPSSLAILRPLSDTFDFYFPDGPPLVPPKRGQPPFHTLENIPERSALNIQHGLHEGTINAAVPSIARVEVPSLFTSVGLLISF